MKRFWKKEKKRKLTFSQMMQEAAPDVREYLNALFLQLNLRFMPGAITTGVTTVAEQLTIARQLAHDTADGDQQFEDSLYNILIAYLSDKERDSDA